MARSACVVLVSATRAKTEFPDVQALAKLVSSEDGRRELAANSGAGVVNISEFWEQPNALYLYVNDPAYTVFGDHAAQHWRVLVRVKTKWISLRISGYNDAKLTKADGFELAKEVVQALQVRNPQTAKLPTLRDLIGDTPKDA